QASSSVSVIVSNQNPAPLTVTFTTLTPPSFSPGPISDVADLKMTISGGNAGQRSIFNVTVFLNAGLAAVSGTAQLAEPSGRTIAGTKSGNSYTFLSVQVDQPGSNGSAVFTITNMEVTTASMAPPAQV